METTPDSNEQWLLDGICQECRRKDFCSKPCKRNKVRTASEIMAYINARTRTGMLLEQINQIVERKEK